MALDVCVKQILCTLSDAALRSIQALIDGQIAIVQTQISVYQTQLLQYDILAAPVRAAQEVAKTVSDEVKKSASFIPLSLIAECADLGDFNLNLRQSADVATQIADDVFFELTRLVSYREELAAIITELNTALTQFSDIRSLVDECLAGT